MRPVARSTMAMMFASRLLIMMLSGWKRPSPASYHWFGPRYEAALMCSQSTVTRSAKVRWPSADTNQVAFATLTVTASAYRPTRQ